MADVGTDIRRLLLAQGRAPLILRNDSSPYVEPPYEVNDPIMAHIGAFPLL